MKKNNRLYITLIILVSVLNSCELYNPAEPVPAYIHIDKFTLTTLPDEGTNSNKITDAWVYVDEQLIGCFELPATFPVLYEGNHQVRIRAGIKINGIAATRAPYPFFDSYETSVNMAKGTTITLKPTVKYFPNTHFDFMENFDNVGILFANSPSGTDTSMQQIFAATDNNVFEGNGSGIAYLDTARTFFECVSNTSYILPKNSAPVFLEFNYKCNHEFVVGLYAHSSTNSYKVAVLTFNSSAEWNKTYLYLTPVIIGSGNSTDYNIFMGMVNKEGADSLALVIDNLKLVY